MFPRRKIVFFFKKKKKHKNAAEIKHTSSNNVKSSQFFLSGLFHGCPVFVDLWHNIVTLQIIKACL